LPEQTYEFRKDAVTYVMLGAAFWLAAGRRSQAAERAGAAPLAASARTDVVWLRDGPARIRIEPADIVMVTSAGNYVEYCMAGGRTHLVRGTLAAEEARLSAFNIVRVHRTRLINLARVSALQSGPSGDFELTLDTGQVVSGSRRYRGAVESVVEQL
jgi:DNA-binding LytR/AlgR family response regulator